MFKFGFLTPGWLLGPSSETSSLIGNIGNILNLSLHISAIEHHQYKTPPPQVWAMSREGWCLDIFARRNKAEVECQSEAPNLLHADSRHSLIFINYVIIWVDVGWRRYNSGKWMQYECNNKTAMCTIKCPYPRLNMLGFQRAFVHVHAGLLCWFAELSESLNVYSVHLLALAHRNQSLRHFRIVAFIASLVSCHQSFNPGPITCRKLQALNAQRHIAGDKLTC